MINVLDVRYNLEGRELTPILEAFKNNFGSIEKLGDIFGQETLFVTGNGREIINKVNKMDDNKVNGSEIVEN